MHRAKWVYYILTFCTPDPQAFAVFHDPPRLIRTSIYPAFQNLAGPLPCVRGVEELKAEHLARPQAEEKFSDLMKLIRITRHELAAVLHVLRWLVLGAINQRISSYQAPSLWR